MPAAITIPPPSQTRRSRAHDARFLDLIHATVAVRQAFPALAGDRALEAAHALSGVFDDLMAIDTKLHSMKSEPLPDPVLVTALLVWVYACREFPWPTDAGGGDAPLHIAGLRHRLEEAEAMLKPSASVGGRMLELADGAIEEHHAGRTGPLLEGT